jgi:hypothetical protein
MGLTSAYLVSANRVSDFFKQIKDGQAPERLTQQLLKDWGFASTNDRAFIPLLKALGFLTPEGKPTIRYNEYRDHSKSRAVLGEAIRDAYSDLFLIKSSPSDADREAIKGKFKSFHNTSDNVAGLMTKTFYSLLALADINAAPIVPTVEPDVREELPGTRSTVQRARRNDGLVSGLHYNIQIHLPPTKDIEVYNAIFKALRVHLVDE